MKIAICLECPLAQHGGVEVLVRALLPGLASEHEIYLVSDDATEQLASTETLEIKGHFRWDPYNSSQDQITRLIDWGRNQAIELFHFHLGGTYSWNSRSWRKCAITQVSKAGFRCVSTNHGAFGFWLFVGEQRSLLYRVLALCVCWSAKLRQVASVEWEATVSKHDYHVVRKWFFPFASRFRQIYHSILDESQTCEIPKKNIIVCLGTVGKRKGQPYLVEAFAKVAAQFPDWRLIIAGRHADETTAKEMCESVNRNDLSTRVDILADVSDDRAKQLLNEASVFAMPSLAEGLGLSLQEALFARAACVGSRIGGISDLILHDQTGLLVPPANASALASALLCLMEDAGLRERLGAAGRNHVIDQDMTRRGMIRRYLQLYADRAKL